LPPDVTDSALGCGCGAPPDVYLGAVAAGCDWWRARVRLRPDVTGGVLSAAVAATLMALNVQSVYELWFLCSDFVFVKLFPQLTCAMFYRYANRWGAMAGLWVAIILRFGGGEPALGLPMFLPYPWVEDGVAVPVPHPCDGLQPGDHPRRQLPVPEPVRARTAGDVRTGAPRPRKLSVATDAT
jgi:hypothetical protein